jgi:uncharacterized protein
MIDLIAGLVIGIGGSLHCAGMCGPLALALPSGPGRTWRYFTGRVIYNVGRMITYMALGVVAGLAGRGLVLAGTQQVVTIAIGIMLLLSIAVPTALTRWIPSFTLPARLNTKILGMLSGLMRRSSSAGLLLIGILNGLLPCGFVYVGLAAAITLGDPLHAMLFMAGFGLGTVPVMLTIALAGKKIQEGVRRKLLRFVPLVTAVLALLLVLRGMSLGIPYISPIVDGQQTAQHHCH